MKYKNRVNRENLNDKRAVRNKQETPAPRTESEPNARRPARAIDRAPHGQNANNRRPADDMRGYDVPSRAARYEDRREMSKSFVVCGVHPVEESLRMIPQSALKSAKLFISESREDNLLAGIIDLAREKSVETESADPRDLSKKCGDTRHQGVLLELPEFRYAELEDVLGRLSPQPLIVVLDQIQDPHNLGAIIRSAAAFGADAVVIPRDRAAQMTAASIKTSAGQAYRIPICRISNIAQTLRELKDLDFRIVGADIAGTPAQNLSFRRATALVMGSEASGMRRLTRTLCDETVRIAQNPDVESLNVSVAAAILMYAASQQRDLDWLK